MLLPFCLVGAAGADDEIHWTVKGQSAVTFDWRGSSSENTIRYGTVTGSYTSTVTGTTGATG